MDMSATVVLLIALALLLAAATPAVYAGWRRITAREGELQIWRALHRRGLGDDDTAGASTQLARAVRRCVLCPSIPECEAWLASGAREGVERFCPNAGLFSDLEGRKKQP